MEDINDKGLYEDINKVMEYSKYYFYDAEYEKHYDNIKKLRKLIKQNKSDKYNKKGSDNDS